jgi:cbb3-type cytochrome oxidase subunit 3
MSEIMSNADLTLYPKIALIIFMGVFLLVTFRVLTMNKRQDIDEAARLALEDGDLVETEGSAS